MGEQVLVDVDELRLVLRVLSRAVDQNEGRYARDRFDLRLGSEIDPAGHAEQMSVTAARAVAVAAGVDPWSVTDRYAGTHYPHPYDDGGGSGVWDPIMGARTCGKCIFPRTWHDPAGELPPSSDLVPPTEPPPPLELHSDGAFMIAARPNTAGIPVLGGFIRRGEQPGPDLAAGHQMPVDDVGRGVDLPPDPADVPAGPALPALEVEQR